MDRIPEDNDTIELPVSGPLRGEISSPPDKSISHRALIFAAISEGRSIIRNLLRADDPMSTLNALRSLGIEIEDNGEVIEVAGRGIHGFREPGDVIDCGNSGTTMRLLAGLLSGQSFFSVLTGDSSLRKRPMNRVVEPLRLMGATLYGRVQGIKGETLPPLAINGGLLRPVRYTSPVASAQVKSAIILAGLYAEGETVIEEPRRSRDHTERMLSACGAEIHVEGVRVSVIGGSELKPFEITVPGDFSSAAFFIVAATVVKGSEVLIRNVGINPTRTGLIDVMRRMGADVEIINEREVSGEPVADIVSRYTDELGAVELGPEEVPSMIDEFPVFAVLATQARGVTTIRGAGELRVKESDRISTMTTELRNMGVEIEEHPDGMSIYGPVKLRGAALEGYNDHRVAMALSVASLIAEGKSTLHGRSAVDISFPGFFDKLKALSKG